MTTLSMRGLDQRHAALREGNRRRAARSRFKKELRRLETHQAEHMVAVIVKHPPDWALSWGITEALRAIPQYGKVKTAKLVRRLKLMEGKTLETLTPGQRLDLVWELTGKRSA